MKEKTSRGRGQDRRLVAGKQEHEVRHEANKMNVSKDEVRSVIASEGNSRDEIERKLDKS